MNVAEQFDRLSHPTTQFFIVVSAGLLCLASRRFRLGGVLVVLAALWLGLCSTPAFATWLQCSLENQYPQQRAADYPKADAIVILGGGNLPDPDIDWRNDDSLAVRATRIGFGLQLYRDGRAPVIVLSGGSREAAHMSTALIRQGVAADVLRTEESSRTTHENALYSASILKRENLHNILLVTSAMHMPRAVASFKEQRLAVVAAPTLDPAHQRQKTRSPWWPDNGALHLSRRCLREYFGLWGYKLLGWA